MSDETQPTSRTPRHTLEQAEARDMATLVDTSHLRHELGTPLNQIIGYAELLIEEAGDLGQDSLLPDLHRIRNAGNTMLLLIDEYLSASPAGGPASSAQQDVFAEPIHHAVVHTAPFPEDAAAGKAHILVVDDFAANRDVLTRRLERQGYAVEIAENGRQALDRLREQPPDLVLLDVIMPEMDGYQLLQILKSDTSLRHVPVIMISALGELDSVVRCIELGAEDYLPKPFNPILLRARIGASLEKKRLRDQEQAYLAQIRNEQEKGDRLLLNVLPAAIAERLKSDETLIADRFDDVSILFADIVGFTPIASSIPPDELIGHLNAIFSAFDRLVDEYGLEKIKTIGDAYMVVGGLPTFRPDHVEAVANLALAMCAAIDHLRLERGLEIALRVGIHTGPVVAGVIGQTRFAYDLWGDTVNVAHRMEAQGEPDRVHVSATVRDRLHGRFQFEPRGSMEIKGKGPMETAFLLGHAALQ